VRREAPSAFAAALASSAAQPRPPRGRPHPAQREAPRRVRQRCAKATPKVRQSSAPDGVPGLAFGVGVTAGKSPCGGPVARKNRGRLAPLGGEDASALDPCDSLTAVRKPPSAAIDEFSRQAVAWSARNFRAPSARRRPAGGDPLPPRRGQGMNGTSPAPTSESSHSACSACDDPSVTRRARLAVTNRCAHQPIRNVLFVNTRLCRSPRN
jgi:hypothetical protein